MSPASGPVSEPKLFPAAVHEDQADILEGNVEPIVLGAPGFSSPYAHTDAQRMLPLEDGTSAYQATEEAAARRQAASYDSMSDDDLRAEAENRGLDVGAKAKSADLVSALREDDASDMKSADFKKQVEAATNQDELDAAAELYEASGKQYSTVETAIEKKQEELDNPDEQ